MSSRSKLMVELARKSIKNKIDPQQESDLDNDIVSILMEEILNEAETTYEIVAPNNTEYCENYSDFDRNGSEVNKFIAGPSNMENFKAPKYSNFSSSSSETCSEASINSINDKTYIPPEDIIESDYSSDISNFVNEDPNRNCNFFEASNNCSVSEIISSNEKSVSNNECSILTSPLKKGRNRKRNENVWKTNLLRKARNSGKAYESRTLHKTIRSERKMKSSCRESCKLKCSTKLTEKERVKIFSEFWELGNLEKQRQYNAEGIDKENLKEKYDQHLVEKEQSRIEKANDKETSDANLAVYDLQAVMQLPKGNVSIFYYKSKLNVLNFTIYNMLDNTTECYVWDESNGQRGVNELGTCVLKYLQNKSEKGSHDFIFYSDNCPGQQKNKFMLSLYLYAVRHLNIQSITHKFLIKGHTHNEGDSVHSLIEREVRKQLKRGPLFTTDAFISAIKRAKKTGDPFKVNELCIEDFYNIKKICTDMSVNITKNIKNETIKFCDIKIVKFEKKNLCSMLYKTSYMNNSFEEAILIKKKKLPNISLQKLYEVKPGITENKKADLMFLVSKNHIPRFYRSFYENL